MSAQTPEPPLSLVVIGDSIPFAEFCTECDHAFVEDYAFGLEALLGVDVEVTNRSRNDGAQLNQIADQVATEKTLQEQLSNADIVIISAGFNDGPPWQPNHPCGGTTDGATAALLTQILSYSDECLDEAIADREVDYERLFDSVAKLVADDSHVIVLSPYDAWTGWSEFDAVATPEQLVGMTDVFSHFLSGWIEMECEIAGVHGFECVDLYHAFNGDDGRSPAGDLLEADYSHPSKTGNALIANLLEDLNLFSLPGTPVATP